MPTTRLNDRQIETLGNSNIATDAELAAALLAHLQDPDPHPQYQPMPTPSENALLVNFVLAEVTTPGTAVKLHYDNFGRVLGGEALLASDLPAIPWSKLENTPTTLAGYGITDAVPTTDLTGPVTSTDGVTSIAPGVITNEMLANNAVADLSGVNTGDETTASIKAKLGISILSGTNTGDQTDVVGNAGTATALQTARLINGVAFDGTANITINAVDLTARIASSLMGIANGIATLDVNGTVPAAQLPSYVDDVLEFATLASFPVTGATGKIYVALDTNKSYRWSGSIYVFITSGAVDSVAGKTGVITLTKADVGLNLVDNTPDASKPVSTIQATALSLKINWSSVGAPNGAAALDGAGLITLSQLPDFSWTKITSDKPTTLAGYGITDGASYITSVTANHTVNAGVLDLSTQPTVNALNLTANTSVAIPSAGNLALMAQTFSNKTQLTQFDSNGRQDPLQRALYANSIVMWMPNSGATVSPSFGTIWLARNSGAGAAQSRPVIANTNNVTKMIRNIFGTGTTTTGSSGIASTEAVAFIGDIANTGGFFLHARFALETYLSSERFFIGLTSSNAAMASNPSTWSNTIGIGKDSTGSTMSFISRSTTASTLIDTLLTPSVSQVYDFYLYCAPGSNSLMLTVMNPFNISAPLASGTITVNTPVVNTPLYLVAFVQATAGTSAKQLALSKLYLETDF